MALAVYRRDLGPGESFAAEFMMPHYPADPALAADLGSASFEERLGAMERYWGQWLSQGAKFAVPEKKVADAARAYLIHILMSQNVISDDDIEQHVQPVPVQPLLDPRLFLFRVHVREMGLPPGGPRHLPPHLSIPAGQRQLREPARPTRRLGPDPLGLWLARALFRRPRIRREVLPRIDNAVGWLRAALDEDAWGLMPPTDAFDNETITGRYTGHNFWALTGLDAAIDLSRLAGRDDLAGSYQDLRDEYYRNFMTRLREVAARQGGIIPPGLDVPGGTEWGNLLAVYPGHIMDPFDPLVTATFDRFRNERMAEGIAMWHQSLHHYVTERVAQTALIRGEQERTLDDFYAMLLHTGACHKGFEWSIWPWDGRDYCFKVAGAQTCNFTPHGWYAADMNILFRNMLVREDGQAIHLCSALSPAWTRPGDRIEVKDAPVWMNVPQPQAHKISFTIDFDQNRARVSIPAPLLPSGFERDVKVILHTPYYLAVKDAKADGAPLPLTDEGIELQGSTCARQGCDLTIEFERLPAPAKSYLDSVEWYKSEYRRRWEEKRSGGNR